MTEAAAAPYRVLARKYRPADFAGLIGQEAMVRTLSNAIRQGRLAHAFILTGVRGVGKTTTARIIARALNCVGADGSGGPTIAPCGACDSCLRIGEDRHVDVLEMDAASRTGIGDIREIIESVRYAPASARYKIYIIDEVHMLSTAAFNGLLKTLEEPPAHVKFIFATTEIRKVPVTVLSRCQRFDLRRVDVETLVAHFERIAGLEGARVEPEALALIARAAEGSVRDGLSLLDQAIAHGGGVVEAAAVRDMLGLADRARVLELYEQVMRGDIGAALKGLRAQYDVGADPAVVLQDMLELTHWLTRIKVTPEAANDVGASETERERGRDMAARLGMPVLNRAWQMLLKGLGETRAAPHPLAAAEMVLVRLAYVAELPAPADLVRELQGKATAPPYQGGGSPAGRTPQGGGGRMTQALPTADLHPPAPDGAPAALARPDEPPAAGPALPDFAAVVALAGEKRDVILKGWLVNYVQLVRFAPGHIEFRPAPGAPRELAPKLMERLRAWTGQRWVVSLAGDPDAPTAPTLAQAEAGAEADRKAAVEGHPLVRQALEAFPGASIRAIRPLAAPAVEPHMDEDGALIDLPDGDDEA